MTYNTLTNLYTVTEGTDNEVYVVDANGQLISQFDTAGFGSDFTTNIAYNSLTDQYPITDSTDGVTYIFSTSGAFSSGFSSRGYASDPYGIAYNSLTEQYAIVDRIDDEVYIVNTVSGNLEAQCDTALLGSPVARPTVALSTLRSYNHLKSNTRGGKLWQTVRLRWKDIE